MRWVRVLVVGLLLTGCTESPSADEDEDGLTNAEERTPHALTLLLKDGTSVTRMVTSDPHSHDTDGDGLSDLDEYVLGSDPRRISTLGGLLDGHDQLLDPASPQAQAWRQEGILEAPPGRFLGKLDLCPQYGGRKANHESGDLPYPDGLSDAEEIQGWTIRLRDQTRQVQSDPCVPDTDRDHLLDHEEKTLGTDPTRTDTDQDGTQDGQDADPLSNLGLLLANITTTAPGPLRLTFYLNGSEREIMLPSATTLSADVDDASVGRTSLPVTALVRANDPVTGEERRVFPQGGSLVLTFDLLGGTLTQAGEDMGARPSFSGPDGSLSFTWTTTRQ